jgi:hypothetical protein
MMKKAIGDEFLWSRAVEDHSLLTTGSEGDRGEAEMIILLCLEEHVWDGTQLRFVIACRIGQELLDLFEFDLVKVHMSHCFGGSYSHDITFSDWVKNDKNMRENVSNQFPSERLSTLKRSVYNLIKHFYTFHT